MVADGSGTVSEATAASSSGFNIAAGSEDSQAGSDGSPPAVQPSSTVIEVLPPPSDTTSPAPLQRVTSAPSRLAPPSPRRTASNPGRLTPGLQVRASLLSRIYRGIGELGGNRRLSLLVTAVLTVAQLVAFVTILALSSGQACDQPLQSYIIVHTVRVTLSWPASFYTALAPRRPSRNDANPSETIRIREARRALGSPAWDSRIRLFQDGMTLLAFTWFILGNYFFFSSHTCRQTSPELYWTSLVVLIFGWLYAIEIIFIILAVTFFLPIVILGIRVFGWGAKKQEIGPITKEQIDKIPLVLYIPAPEDEATQGNGNGEASPSSEPEASKDVEGSEAIEMKEVPASAAEQTAPAEASVTDESSAGPKTNSQIPPATPAVPDRPAPPVPTERQRGRRRRRLARLFFHVKRHPKGSPASKDSSFSTSDAAYIPTPYPLHPLPANQSTCPICLCDFEPPPARDSGVDPVTHPWEPLRRLPACGHCFHRDCLDEWLGTSGRCPLCQVPIVAKKEGRKRRRTTTGGTDAMADDTHA